jgi:membrane protease YdiL (CAAX protease family)
VTQQLPGAPATPYVWAGGAWIPAPPGYAQPVAWWPHAGGGWVPAPVGWVPPPDWVRTPSGAFPPPTSNAQPLAYAPPVRWGVQDPTAPALTRGFGWVRCLPGRLQRAAAVGDRKPSGWEILVVLSIFPGEAVASALISLAQTLTNYNNGSAHSPELTPRHPALGALLLALDLVLTTGPALVALYLLTLSGGGPRAIGLDLTRPRADLARVAKTVLYSFVPGFVLLGILIHLTPHIHLITDATTPALPLWFTIPAVVTSINAGIVEEIVVLGFLVHRLEQRGWDGWRLYAVCIAVRVSYHLYYGTGAIGLLVWAGMMVFLYRRRRRLLTFIAAHVLWDLNAGLGSVVHGHAAGAVTLAIVAVAFLAWLVFRGAAVDEVRESSRALAQGDTARAGPT